MLDLLRLIDAVCVSARDETNIVELKSEPFGSIAERNKLTLYGIKHLNKPTGLRINSDIYISLSYILSACRVDLRSLWLAYTSSRSVRTSRHDGTTGYLLIMYAGDQPAYAMVYDSNTKVAKLFVNTEYLSRVLNIVGLLEE